MALVSTWLRTTTTMSTPPSPTPKHLLRSHGAPVSVVWISDDNERIYSGDAAGTVVATSTRTLRALATWKAHTDGLLGVQEWEEHVITYVCATPSFSPSSSARGNKG